MRHKLKKSELPSVLHILIIVSTDNNIRNVSIEATVSTLHPTVSVISNIPTLIIWQKKSLLFLSFLMCSVQWISKWSHSYLHVNQISLSVCWKEFVGLVTRIINKNNIRIRHVRELIFDWECFVCIENDDVGLFLIFPLSYI